MFWLLCYVNGSAKLAGTDVIFFFSSFSFSFFNFFFTLCRDSYAKLLAAVCCMGDASGVAQHLAPASLAKQQLNCCDSCAAKPVNSNVAGRQFRCRHEKLQTVDLSEGYNI